MLRLQRQGLWQQLHSPAGGVVEQARWFRAFWADASAAKLGERGAKGFGQWLAEQHGAAQRNAIDAVMAAPSERELHLQQQQQQVVNASSSGQALQGSEGVNGSVGGVAEAGWTGWLEDAPHGASASAGTLAAEHQPFTLSLQALQQANTAADDTAMQPAGTDADTERASTAAPGSNAAPADGGGDWDEGSKGDSGSSADSDGDLQPEAALDGAGEDVDEVLLRAELGLAAEAQLEALEAQGLQAADVRRLVELEALRSCAGAPAAEQAVRPCLDLPHKLSGHPHQRAAWLTAHAMAWHGMALPLNGLDTVAGTSSVHRQVANGLKEAT